MRLQEQVVEQQKIINNLLNQWGEPLREEPILGKVRPKGMDDQIQARIEQELVADLKKAQIPKFNGKQEDEQAKVWLEEE